MQCESNAATTERPAMTDDIDAIVRGLSKAQREALALGKWNFAAVSTQLNQQGILERVTTSTGWPYSIILTPIGIAVRDRITAQKGGDV